MPVIVALKPSIRETIITPLLLIACRELKFAKFPCPTPPCNTRVAKVSSAKFSLSSPSVSAFVVRRKRKGALIA